MHPGQDLVEISCLRTSQLRELRLVSILRKELKGLIVNVAGFVFVMLLSRVLNKADRLYVHFKFEFLFLLFKFD